MCIRRAQQALAPLPLAPRSSLFLVPALHSTHKAPSQRRASVCVNTPPSDSCSCSRSLSLSCSSPMRPRARASLGTAPLRNSKLKPLVLVERLQSQGLLFPIHMPARPVSASTAIHDPHPKNASPQRRLHCDDEERRARRASTKRFLKPRYSTSAPCNACTDTSALNMRPPLRRLGRSCKPLEPVPERRERPPSRPAAAPRVEKTLAQSLLLCTPLQSPQNVAETHVANENNLHSSVSSTCRGQVSDTRPLTGPVAVAAFAGMHPAGRAHELEAHDRTDGEGDARDVQSPTIAAYTREQEGGARDRGMQSQGESSSPMKPDEQPHCESEDNKATNMSSDDTLQPLRPSEEHHESESAHETSCIYGIDHQEKLGKNRISDESQGQQLLLPADSGSFKATKVELARESAEDEETVRRVYVPPLTDAPPSRDARIRMELRALREQRKVAGSCGGHPPAQNAIVAGGVQFRHGVVKEEAAAEEQCVQAPLLYCRIVK